MRVSRNDVVTTLNYRESQMAKQVIADAVAASCRALFGFLTLMNYRGAEETELDCTAELARRLARQ